METGATGVEPATSGVTVVAMFDFPALDVAIGLLFLYLVLALVCSTVNEAISTAFGMRARFLQLVWGA